MNYIIHFHSGHKTETDHYDFMIEDQQELLTWRVLQPDLEKLINGQQITATRINNHRREYLDFEGPISCDRGQVAIFDQGSYTGTIDLPVKTKIILKGKKLSGTLIIILLKDTEFNFTLLK